MGKWDSMKQLSALFQVAPSALRYWEEQGLVRFRRDPQNGYRTPTYQTLIDLWDVFLYRSLSLPVKEMRGIPGLQAQELDALLLQNEQLLEQRAAALQKALEQNRRKRRALSRLRELWDAPFVTERRVMPAARRISFQDPEDVAAVFLGDARQSGMLVMPGESGPPAYVLLERPPRCGETRLCLRGLFRADTEAPERHNAQVFYEAAEKRGFTPGTLVGSYLASVREGRRYDCYEAWLELLEG